MPVTKFDEFLVQQIPTSSDHVEDSDRRWYERYWFGVSCPGDGVSLVHGLGVYPNANLIDAFGRAAYGGVQWNVGALRTLEHERMDTQVGPLSVNVEEGLRRVRIACEQQDGSIGYELELEAIGEPLDRTRMEFQRLPGGRVHQRSSMFVQLGRASGHVVLDGREFVLRPQDCTFVKTNSWGIRSHVGGLDAIGLEPRSADGRHPWVPSSVFLAARVGNLNLVLMDQGGELSGESGVVSLRDVRHEITSEVGDRSVVPASMTSRMVDDTGAERTVRCSVSASVRLDQAFGAYKDYFDGFARDPANRARVSTQRLDFGDRAVFAAAAGRDDHMVDVTLDGETGSGILEVGVRGREPYGRVQ